MQFGHPKILWLLLVFPPALIAFYWWSWRARRRLLTRFIEARLLGGLLAGVSLARRKIRWGCLVLAAVCLILALARPQWGFTLQEVRQRGLDIVVAIDTSKSMLAEDIPPNRLARAKLAALDLMQQAKSDRLGLVTFAGSAFLQCPLTFDDAAFRQSVETLDVNVIPQGGTALADAIDTALTAFKEEDSYRMLVLFTDGEDQDTGALEAARRAGKAGLRIYCIGVGSAEGELLRVKDAKGRTDYIRDDQGNVVKSRLNETLLRDLAQATEGGFYLPLRGAKAIDALYAELAKLPKSEHQEKTVRQYMERYHWPLGLALALLTFEMLFPERRRERKKTASGAHAGASGPWVQTALWTLMLAVPVDANATPAKALREYQQGQYEKSLRDYQDLLRRRQDDPRLHFNAGAAAYRNQQFDEAAKEFNEVLAAPDVKLQQQAYYNLGNALFRRGEQLPEASAPPQSPAAPNSGPDAFSANSKKEAWEKSAKSFESAWKLNEQDADAKFNYEFVKKKLEELRQQEQQQQQQQQNQDKDNSDQNKQQQAGQQKENEESKEQQAKNQQDQKREQSPEETKNQEQQQAQNQNQPKPQENQQSQASSAPKEKEQDPTQSSPAAAAGQMTQQQAQQLLDAQKNNETLLPIKPEDKAASGQKRLRDW